MSNKQTLLIGSFGAENIGDELILHSALEKYPDSVVMTAQPEKSQEFLERTFKTTPPFPTGFRSFLNFILKKQYQEYKSMNKNIDQIVFPGGGLFKNSLKAVWIWTMNIFWCRHFFPGKKIVMESQGVDLSENTFGKAFLKWGLKNVSEISVRDTQSQKNVEKISGKKVKVIGDAVENHIKTKNTGKIPGKKVLINAVNEWNYKSLIKRVDQKEINFIAFDKQDLQKVPKKFLGKTFFPKTISELWEVFESHNTFVGQRFHFLILANNFGGKENTFLLGSPYAPKTAEYQKQNSLKQI